MKVTMALFACNRERFVAEAIDGIFKQSIQPDEIILSDDGSSDSTFEIIEAAASRYSGSAELRVRRNEINRGSAVHFNQVMSESRGDVLIKCDDDDISLPDRLKITKKCFEGSEEVMACSVRHAQINELGKVTKQPEATASADLRVLYYDRYLRGGARHPVGATRAYRREIYEVFGPLAPECPSEDTPLLFRSMLLGEFRESQEIGLLYRRHADNLSSPERVKTRRIDQLEVQHRKDLCIARTAGLVDESTYRRYVQLLDEYWARRWLKSKLTGSSFGDLRMIFSESNLSGRDKVTHTRGVIRRVARRILGR